MILGVLTFFPAVAELAAERLLANGVLTPATPLLTMLTGFRYGGLELVAGEEEAATHRELLVLKLLRVAVVVLLGTAVVEDDV